MLTVSTGHQRKERPMLISRRFEVPRYSDFLVLNAPLLSTDTPKPRVPTLIPMKTLVVSAAIPNRTVLISAAEGRPRIYNDADLHTKAVRPGDRSGTYARYLACSLPVLEKWDFSESVSG